MDSRFRTSQNRSRCESRSADAQSAAEMARRFASMCRPHHSGWRAAGPRDRQPPGCGEDHDSFRPGTPHGTPGSQIHVTSSRRFPLCRQPKEQQHRWVRRRSCYRESMAAGNVDGSGPQGLRTRIQRSDCTGPGRPLSALTGSTRSRSLMGQWATARFERFRRLGCLRSLRAHWHLMGSAGCRAARLKSQSASETACYRIGAVICPLPGRRSARELGWTSVS